MEEYNKHVATITPGVVQERLWEMLRVFLDDEIIPYKPGALKLMKTFTASPGPQQVTANLYAYLKARKHIDTIEDFAQVEIEYDRYLSEPADIGLSDEDPVDRVSDWDF